ncbi:MAG: GNAT family N-acetyltransferase [Bacteroidetes bacterium]|jgi:N-acetylglutamate synthase-like GNAT family acetyltransferase|nr:GNAT family N-acetyltransferase [Bacteroidota bacterium]MBK8369032.1 GNAT family N-acetyltransferase [Bacteroidota bacterium]
MYKVQIAKTQTQIDAIIDLRYDILRKPWNQPKETSSDGMEQNAVNAFIEDNGKTIACGRLQDNGGGVGQIRYMAVDSNYQGKGLGKLIVTKLEEEARKINLHTIELQARENAVEFYKSQGYVVKETSFKLWDIIQHYLMTKEIK